MKIRQITGALEEFAPLALQDGYDNAGLQIGLAEDAEATGALLCLDVTEEVLDEAIHLGCNLVVSHHPLLFRPLKQIAGRDYIERCVIKAIKNDITVYAAHTNLDSARDGVNYKIAERLGLQQIEWLSPKQGFDAGEGIVGLLPQPMEKEDFLAMVKELFDVDALRYNSWTGEQVQRIAVCGGAGNFLIPTAVQQGCDAFLTGEVGYHRFFGHEDELLLMELGHYESEQFTVQLLQDIIRKTDPELPVNVTTVETNPINYL
ncbi:MAG: Nif3-like dinuclear metal center hexameric protein [Bacteroidaceae bacterium]|nr:Nif3-like dinuclear metal center hexameric protein [Bacteroidaceae bacterium]